MLKINSEQLGFFTKFLRCNSFLKEGDDDLVNLNF